MVGRRYTYKTICMEQHWVIDLILFIVFKVAILAANDGGGKTRPYVRSDDWTED